MPVLPIRCIGVLPILINRQKQYEHADAEIIPRRDFQFEIAVQKGIDEGEESQSCHQPIGERNLVVFARKKPAQRKCCYAKPEQQIFPLRSKNRVINCHQYEGRDHQPETQNKI